MFSHSLWTHLVQPALRLTGFQAVEDVMGKTCSNSWPVGVLLFYVALLPYSLWKAAKSTRAMCTLATLPWMHT